MPLSYRLIISVVLGCALGALLPLESLPFSGLWGVASQGFLILWRYLAFPFLFFGLIIAVAQLKRQKQLFASFSMNAILIVGSAFVMTLLGSLLGMILPIKRIPVQFEKVSAETAPAVVNILEALFPANALAVLGAGSLLPLAILAVLIGINLAFDREVAEPSYNLADSLSRIFYHIFEFTMKYSWVPLFFFSIQTALSLKAKDLTHYQSFLWTTTISLTICFILYILILCYFLTTQKNPAHWLHKVFAYFPIALFSPNIHINACASSYMSHKFDRVKRDAGGFTAPLFVLFSRVGSVFVCSMAMITILRSYSSLNLTFFQIFMVFFYAFLASFFVSHRPEGSLLAMLPIACLLYGRPLASSSHILEPVMVHITLVASFFDSIMISFAKYFLANCKYTEKNKKLPLQKKTN